MTRKYPVNRFTIPNDKSQLSFKQYIQYLIIYLSFSETESGSQKTDTSIGRPKNESAESKKARKNAVKEANREKRKNKIPKHVKKRQEKIAKKK